MWHSGNSTARTSKTTGEPRKPHVGPGTFPRWWPQQLWPGIQLDESFPNSQDGGLSAIIDLELMKNIPHVVLDGLFAQVQVIGNFLVRLAVRDQA